MSYMKDGGEAIPVDEFTQCKCGHTYYIGLCECPMCKLDREEEPYGLIAHKDKENG